MKQYSKGEYVPTRGGKREGAGRPESEKTVTLRVPIGVLDDVKRAIEQYKTGKKTEKSVSDLPISKVSAAIIAPKAASNRAETAKAREFINRLDAGKKRALIAKHGSIEKASYALANAGKQNNSRI
jgi:hypothetical protein